MRVATLNPGRSHRPVPFDCPLTPAQFDTLCEIADGKTYKQVAHAHGVSASTVRDHVYLAYRRLGVSCQKQAISMMLRNGWLGWHPPRPDPPARLTPFQHAYLKAFDEHLATGSARSRRAMRIALYGVRNEAGLGPIAAQRPGRDPMERLVAAIYGDARRLPKAA
jgi:DNA-binding CsgD family transcriptional regulator